MLAFEEPTVELTLVAPGSFVRALLRRMMVPGLPHDLTDQELSAGKKPSATGVDAASQTSEEPIPTGSLDWVPHLVGRFPLIPGLALTQANPQSDGTDPGGPDTTGYGGVQAVGAEFLHAIASVANGNTSGEKLAQTSQASPIVKEERPTATMVEEALLSPREMEVLELLASCASNREVAESLSISINTVKTHVRHIMSKLKTKNRARTALVGAKLLQENSSSFVR